jgi:hypothetical protein
MVFDCLDFLFNGLLAQSQQGEQFRKGLVPHLDVIGDGAALNGQGKAAIFFIIDKAAPGKAANHVGNRGTAQREGGCNICHARISLALDQFLYPFQMVFR